MKRLILSFCLLLTIYGLQAQTIVSTDVQQTNAVLEEFGGIYCVFCPDGHAIGNNILENNPDAVLINIQSGFFADPDEGDPDYRTDFGEAIDAQSGLAGYPAGTINRRVFPGLEQGDPGTTAVGRGGWANAVNMVQQTTSVVNVAATAELDVATRALTIYVEYYYTGNSDEATNMLNIALLQNGIVGPQTGGNMGDNYVHKHVLRHLITGQWGAEIPMTTAGTFGSETYVYTLPEDIRDIPVDPSEIELAIFIAEDRQNILNGISLTPTYNVAFNVDASALAGSSLSVICGDEVEADLTIRNDGNDTLTSLTIEYSVNGGTAETYNWTGSLATYQKEDIRLPAIAYTGMEGVTNVIDVTVSNPNAAADEGADNNSIAINFENAPLLPTNTLTLELRTDDYGYETYWEVVNDEDGTVVASGGNQTVAANGGGQQTATATNPGAYANNTTYTEEIEIPADGCYTFRILDDYSDGICCGFGDGFYNLSDADGNLLLAGGNFSNDQQDPFRAELPSALTDFLKDGSVKVFPNPVTNREFSVVFDLLETVNMDVALFNAAGQQVISLGRKNYLSGLTQLTVATDGLPDGVYYLSLVTNEDALTEKVVIFK